MPVLTRWGWSRQARRGVRPEPLIRDIRGTLRYGPQAPLRDVIGHLPGQHAASCQEVVAVVATAASDSAAGAEERVSAPAIAPATPCAGETGAAIRRGSEKAHPPEGPKAAACGIVHSSLNGCEAGPGAARRKPVLLPLPRHGEMEKRYDPALRGLA